jgi:thiol:disulfide interchange protein
LNNVSVEILGIADASLHISQVTDVKTGSVNDLLTPNRNLKIAGNKLKIAGDDAVNGIYFVNQTTQERTKVDASEIVTNNPSELIIVIPELTAGTYKVEVTTQYSSSNGVLKSPRTAVFDKILTVQ